MRRRYLGLGALLLAALPLAALVKSCGYTARINVRPLYYNETQYVSFARCDAPTNANQVDILYSLISAEKKVIGLNDPLLPSGASNGQRILFPEPLTVEGQNGKTVTATVTGNEFVKVSTQDGVRGFVFLMDNSRSLNGFDENTNQRIPLTDPNDQRLAGAQNFINSDRFTSKDKATIIAFHGDGPEGLDAKQRANPDEAPTNTWFSGNRGVLADSISGLRNQEDGKTPLYDAIGLGTAALRTLPRTVDPVIVLFSDGPDNSSEATLDEARDALTGEPNTPMFAVAIASQLTVGGEDRLRDLACSTAPQGAVLLATGSTTSARFDPLQFATTGYWKAKLDLQLNGGALPAGRYIVTGRMFADPSDAPKACDGTGATACPTGMECDSTRTTTDTPDGQCFVRVSFTYTVQ